MLFKLAIRNIHRSVRDYAIYFVTLLIAIMVFYAFNSVSDQEVMRKIASSNNTNVIEMTGFMMSIFSTVVAIVLGFLVIYANQLLIRRRKHEFGMYFTLGMTASQVSRIILYETVLVGFISLLLGLALGVLISQLLSFATAALFGIPMPDYQFEFSLNAFIMTLVCFLAIYVVVAIFNVFSIRRCKLINLLNAEARNQKVAIRNPWVCLVLFIISLGILAAAYWLLKENGMVSLGDEPFVASTVLMLVGTLLLFFSLSGFLIAIITHMRGFYLKKLRPFTTRQIASKVNTSFASVWVVCVMLFFAITTFATGMGLCAAFTADIEDANPYDASILSVQSFSGYQTDRDNRGDFDIRQTEAYLREHISDWDELIADSARIDVVVANTTYGDIINATGATISSNTNIEDQYLEAIGLSQYNEALELQGKQPINLEDNQYLVLNNSAASESVAKGMANHDYELNIAGKTLRPLPEIAKTQLMDFDVLATFAMVVLPDATFKELLNSKEDLMNSYLNLTYTSPDTEDVFMDRIIDSEVPGVTNILTRHYMISQAMGLRMLITYLALYIGLVLLVATAAVLAIQLLSLTIDSLSRYRMLNRLGCDRQMLSRSIFAQVLLYFIFPLAVAVCHSAWAIWILSETLFQVLGTDLFPTIMMSAGFVLLIYGSYLIITYLASNATVRQSLK